MFNISKKTELTPDIVSTIIKQFQTNELPKDQKLRNYYDGKQNILSKKFSDETKPCNKIITNYCKNIVDNYLGYLTGIAVSYDVDDAIHDILNYNDVQQEDNELLRDALIVGKSYELHYVDEEGKLRFRIISPLAGIPVYDDSLNNDLLYFIRFYKENSYTELQNCIYHIEVYSDVGIAYYSCQDSFSTLNLDDYTVHHYGQVPVTVMSLNPDERSIFEPIMSLQDAYNTLISSETDDFQAFCDAYLVVTGGTLGDDPENIHKMKENRIIELPDSDMKAEYLVKNITDTQIENMLKRTKDDIHKIANSPDFTDEKFLASSGIAMKFKLVGMENTAASIANNLEKALRKRLELISSIHKLVGSEFDWLNCNITISRNLPANVVEQAQVVNTLRGVVSDQTLISQLPFVDDVNDEMQKIKEQKDENNKLNMQMFQESDNIQDDDKDDEK